MKIIGVLSAAVFFLAAAPLSAEAPAAATPYLQDFSIVLPADSRIAVQLIVPPSDNKTIAKMAWNDVLFAVGKGDTLWFGHDSNVIVNFSRGFIFRTDMPFSDIAVLPGGALLVAGRTDLGFIPVAGIVPTNGRTAAVSVQPIFSLPADNCKLSVGENDALYFFGKDKTSGKEGVYLARPESVRSGRHDGKAVRTIRKIYESAERVSAVAGDGDNTVIATGRLIIRVTEGKDGVVPLFQHPREVITGLALSRTHGLFYATPSGVGYTGPNGTVEFIKAPNTSIRFADGDLYVFLRNTLAVAKVKGLSEFHTLRLSVPAK